jgi:protein-S-isoprenylcysteine O-methyltransferase Ste14
MPPFFLRFGYVCEFLLAILAITVFWGEVGGQEHLDLMPWYAKFLLIACLALVIVLGTAAAVSGERGWNVLSVTCLVVALLIAGGMGVVTYYYHLHEEDEDQDDNVGVALVAHPVGKAPR